MSGRIFIGIIFSMMLSPLLAQDREPVTLLNMARLSGDIEVDGVKENARTLVEASAVSFIGGKGMSGRRYSSLAPGNWKVLFLPSLVGSPSSLVRETTVSASDLKYAPGSPGKGDIPVMEIVIDFTEAPPGTQSAIVLPPFAIPAFQDRTALVYGAYTVIGAEKGKKDKFDSFGVLRDARILKFASLYVFSQAYKERLSLVFEDEEGRQTIFPFEDMDYEGWKTLVMPNPDYIEQTARCALGEPRDERRACLRFHGFIVERSDSTNTRLRILRVHSVMLMFEAK